MIAMAVLPAITESGLPIRFSPRTVFEDEFNRLFCLDGGIASSLRSSPAVQTLTTSVSLISLGSRHCRFGLVGRAFHEAPVQIGILAKN